MRTLKNIHISEMNQNFNVDLHETDDGHLVNLKELFTIDGEYHLNYRSILDLTESEIPAEQVELLKAAVISNTELVESKLNEIIEFVKSIPGSYEGYEIISEPRREYYLKSFITRFEDVLKKRRDELCS